MESSPKQDGRNMIMVLAPHKNAADLKRADAATKGKALDAADEAPASDEAAAVAQPTDQPG